MGWVPDGPGLWIWDGLGQRRVDYGNIAELSLMLSGSTLSWVKDGFRRMAELY